MYLEAIPKKFSNRSSHRYSSNKLVLYCCVMFKLYVFGNLRKKDTPVGDTLIQVMQIPVVAN